MYGFVQKWGITRLPSTWKYGHVYGGSGTLGGFLLMFQTIPFFWSGKSQVLVGKSSKHVSNYIYIYINHGHGISMLFSRKV